MTELTNQKLNEVHGGINITGTFISSLVRGIDVIMDLGRSLGSAFRRAKDRTLCSY